MSLVFVVDSESQLRNGYSWCRDIADKIQRELFVVVCGEDRKTLVELVRRTLVTASDDQPGDVSDAANEQSAPVASEIESDESRAKAKRIAKYVSSVPNTTEAMLSECKRLNAGVLVMIHGHDGNADQQALFEASSIKTLWMRCTGPVPTDQRRIVEVARGAKPVGTAMTETLLKMIPDRLLVDVANTVDLDGSDFVRHVTDTVAEEEFGEGDLLVLGVESKKPNDRLYRAGRELLAQHTPVSMILMHGVDSVTKQATDQFDSLVGSLAEPMQRPERLALVEELEVGAIPNWEYVGLISAAAMLAAFGLVQNSAAVIIGAMLIAPLMTPILGAGLAIAHGNKPLFISALKTITVGFLGALGSTVMFGLLVRFTQGTEITSEMWARCSPTWLDFCVGLVGGIAASYARTRSHLSSALAGAAIAAALVPPISTAGLQIAMGQFRATSQGWPVVGPLLLVSINVLTIMVGSSIVLWLRGIRSDHQFGAQSRWAPRMLALLFFVVLIVLVGLIEMPMASAK